MDFLNPLSPPPNSALLGAVESDAYPNGKNVIIRAEFSGAVGLFYGLN
jgi:hypothetical protein